MDTPFLIGSRVYLRPVLEKDASLLMTWSNDPEIRPLTFLYLPVTEKGAEQMIETIRNGLPYDIVWMICLKENDMPIGRMGLYGINWRDRTAATRALLGVKEEWDQGYGTEAKMLVLDYAFNELDLRKIHSQVFGFNKRSLAYLEKTGYKVIGVRKKEVRRGNRYYDVLLLEVWKEDFRKLQKAKKKRKK